MVSLQTEVAGIKLNNCIYNASGARCTTEEELDLLAKSQAGAILTKSCTYNYREGNPKPRYWQDFSYYDACPWNISINSTGLANMGYQYYVDYGEKLEMQKPYIISVAGLNYKDKLKILEKIHQSEEKTNISAIELNISCPNLKESDTNDSGQLGYNTNSLQNLLDSIYEFWPSAELNLPSAELNLPSAELNLPSAELNLPSAELNLPSAELNLPSAELNLPSAELNLPSAELNLPSAELNLPSAELNLQGKCEDTIPIGLKLPPYFDLNHMEQVSDVIKRYPIGFVTCVNSLGNGLVIDLDTECPVIKPRGGHGGIGGSPILPISLANVRHFHKCLPDHISVVGCGGVQSGSEAFKHILVGASAVQIGTQLMVEGPACFDRVSKELQGIMAKKGYNSLEDFKGKLLQDE